MDAIPPLFFFPVKPYRILDTLPGYIYIGGLSFHHGGGLGGLVMKNLIAYQVDAFTTEPFGGNPAVIILDADALDDRMMQLIASEVYLSESAFVSAPNRSGSSFAISFFTPSEEINMSGHALIAACFSMISQGRVPLEEGSNRLLIDTRDRVVPVAVKFSGSPESPSGEGLLGGMRIEGVNSGTLEEIMILQKIDNPRPSEVSLEEISGILGIDKSVIRDTGLPMETVKAGIEIMLIPFVSKEALLDLNPDLIKLNLLNRKHGILANHIFTLDTFSEDCVTYCRDFVPSIGMWEDPASGTCSAALGMYLLQRGIASPGTLLMEQGKDRETLARIMVKTCESESESGSIWVGGLAVTSITKSITIEEDRVNIS